MRAVQYSNARTMHVWVAPYKMYGGPYKMYGASYILYGAAIHAWCAQYCTGTVLRAFSHFHAIYRCFPYSCTLCKPHSQLKIDPTPTPRTPVIGVPDLRITHHMCKCPKKPSAESHKCNALALHRQQVCALYSSTCGGINMRIASRGTVGGWRVTAADGLPITGLSSARLSTSSYQSPRPQSPGLVC